MNSTNILILVSLLTLSLTIQEVVESAKLNPQITVMGIVYCDVCSNNTFSKHSYFLPGVGVKIDCTFKAISVKTTEEIKFSVNRTTNKYGVYYLEIPSVDGVECARENEVVSSCRASLTGSSSSSCDVPAIRTTSDEISVKSKPANVCFYSLTALSYRPSRKDLKLCKN